MMIEQDRKTNNLTVLRIVFLLLGAVFVVLGVLTSEHLSVLSKAVRICLECIGIG